MDPFMARDLVVRTSLPGAQGRQLLQGDLLGLHCYGMLSGVGFFPHPHWGLGTDPKEKGSWRPIG